MWKIAPIVRRLKGRDGIPSAASHPMRFRFPLLFVAPEIDFRRFGAFDVAREIEPGVPLGERFLPGDALDRCFDYAVVEQFVADGAFQSPVRPRLLIKL